MKTAGISDVFNRLKNDYTLGRPSRTRREREGLPIGGGDQSYHLRDEWANLRGVEVARDIENNDPVVGSALRKLCANVLMNGITLSPATGDKAIDNDIKPDWVDFQEKPERCDFEGELSLAEQERIGFRRTMVDGDIWWMWTNEGNLQSFEYHQCRSPRFGFQPGSRIENGVERDGNHRKTAVWLTGPSENGFRVTQSTVVTRRPIRDDLGRRQILQLFDPHRFRSSRGVSALNAPADLAEKHDDLQFANLLRAQIAACVTFIRKHTIDANPPLGTVTEREDNPDWKDSITPYGNKVEDWEPGTQIVLDDGEEVEGFTPSIPNAEFFSHTELVLGLLAVNLELPLVCMLLDARNTNFNGFRGALDQARLRFRQMQQMTAKLRRFAYTRYIIDRIDAEPALERAANRSGIDLFGHTITPPVWPYLQPIIDVEADTRRLRAGMTSPRRLHSERGQVVETIQDETIEDNSRAIVAAKTSAQAINAQFDDGQPVHWREVLNLPTPEGTQLSLNNEQPQERETTQP